MPEYEREETGKSLRPGGNWLFRPIVLELPILVSFLYAWQVTLFFLFGFLPEPCGLFGKAETHIIVMISVVVFFHIIKPFSSQRECCCKGLL